MVLFLENHSCTSTESRWVNLQETEVAALHREFSGPGTHISPWRFWECVAGEEMVPQDGGCTREHPSATGLRPWQMPGRGHSSSKHRKIFPPFTLTTACPRGPLAGSEEWRSRGQTACPLSPQHLPGIVGTEPCSVQRVAFPPQCRENTK